MAYSRKAVVDLICSWYYEGKSESNGGYKEIIDIYNGYSGTLPRNGLKMAYNWPWCACTWSALAIKLGYTDIMPIEISCGLLIESAKIDGIWVENDGYVPKPADAILYDWDDNGVGDNTGAPDHIGTIISVDEKAGYFVVIEGNYNSSVKKRTVSINGKYIRGFICPKYDEEDAQNSEDVIISGQTLSEVAHEVINLQWGVQPDRQKLLESRGYVYAEIQAEVNRILNGTEKVIVKKSEVSATCAAKCFTPSLSGRYVVTANSFLYLRNDAGTNKRAIGKIPSGTIVNNYGYYTTSNGSKWLYIQYELDGVTYTGFSHESFLKKVG